ncbi:sugar transferase [Aliifodinibius sp. S!AR15-10]|uniref:sugar transferase n=1 Tax=Aliifodinibius sp. S!AR15-10 TaxID=2950437 RepID=UPI00286FF8E8|nr:sugar transferase [Aliifodinibius sp. S!AR15-10]
MSVSSPTISRKKVRKKNLNVVPILRKDPVDLRIKSISFNYNKVLQKNQSWKRPLDITLGTIGMVFFMLLYPFIALGIKLSSNGPVIFKQDRTGYDGNVFSCYKFRTMHCNKEYNSGDKPDITKKKDSRIFAFGELLRKSNLDEIPQFINILKGDMSLVGPRPYPVKENHYWENTFPDFYKRLAVKPGLTGLAQATGFRGGTLNLRHMRERLRRDLLYIKKSSPSMDLKLIYLTLRKMATGNTDAN